MASLEPAGARRSTMTTLLGVVVVIACLYWARAVAIPVALSLLLAFLLTPLVTALQRRRVPAGLAVTVVVLLLVAALGVITQVVGYEVAVLADELPRYRG